MRGLAVTLKNGDGASAAEMGYSSSTSAIEGRETLDDAPDALGSPSEKVVLKIASAVSTISYSDRHKPVT